MSHKHAVESQARRWQAGGSGVFLLVLGVVLAGLFWRVADPARVVFNNDGPLGAQMAAQVRVPATFTGAWMDLNGFGTRSPGAPPNITVGFFWLLGPLWFSKLYAPITLLILGAGAWFLFRQLRLGPPAALLGGLAAALAPDFFCVSCWGVGPQAVCFGLNYLALGLVVSPQPLRPWLRYPLAGLAVGMGVMEAYDIGAIFSAFTALFVMVHALVTTPGPVKGFVQGGLRVATLAGFAVFIAATVLVNLVGTQIKGVAGTGQDAQTKAEGWDKATWGSFPVSEVPGLIVPGVFGYRMMGLQGAPENEAYWGKGGRDPSWDRYFASGKQGPPPHGPIRWGGGGSYLGVLVMLIAFWALLQSFRKEQSVFALTERRFIWFWTAVAVVCLLLSFGRNAPFYQFFYALPYASTIRIPSKFIHVLQWALLIVFAYGVSGLGRSCMEPPATMTRDLVSQLQSWWARASAFDKRWVKGTALLLGACVLGWLAYIRSRSSLVEYLQEVQFDEIAANAIASFSISQVGVFVLLLAVALGLFTLVLSGYFNGRRVVVGTVLLAAFLVVDLARVGSRWVMTYDWKDRYLNAADNGVFQFLRRKPHEGRVAVWPFQLPPQFGIVQQLYQVEWLQHQFQYYNIQSLDIIQMPRMPQDIAAFQGALTSDGRSNTLHCVARRWQLANTRYLLGPAGLFPMLNSEIDPARRFRPLMLFEFYQNQAGGTILARTNSEGPFALFEFTGALPRAKLVSQWKVSTNDTATIQDWVKGIQARVSVEMGASLAAQSPVDLATLHELASPTFDPAQTVLLSEPLPAPAGTNQVTGEVSFENYAPKRLVLRARTAAPAVLLLNDKYDPDWTVTLNGQPARLLRCNFIMRGVFLEKPGDYRVEFRFAPPQRGLYVSLAALGVTALLLGVLVVSVRRQAGSKAG